MREKITEEAIKNHMRRRDGWGQKVQSGAVKTAHGSYIELAEAGTPDMILCVPIEITPEMVGKRFGAFVGVEVKKDEKEVQRWQNLRERWAAGEELPKTAKRERAQAKMAKWIVDAGGFHLVTHSLPQFIEDMAPIFPLIK